jgi:hypothetical protein
VTAAVPERPSTVDPEDPSDLLAHLATRLWLGVQDAALVTVGFFWVLTRAGWCRATPSSPEARSITPTSRRPP